jgi:hypothetical protein
MNALVQAIVVSSIKILGPLLVKVAENMIARHHEKANEALKTRQYEEYNRHVTLRDRWRERRARWSK